MAKGEGKEFMDIRVRERPVTKHELDLVLAWLEGDLRTKPLYEALGQGGSGQVHSAVTAILRRAIQLGWVTFFKPQNDGG